MVGIVPEFGGDEDLRAWDAGFFDGGADGGLGAIAVVWSVCEGRHKRRLRGVHASSVNVPIPGLQSLCDSSLLSVGILPCPKPNCWNLCSSIQWELCIEGCHCASCRGECPWGVLTGELFKSGRCDSCGTRKHSEAQLVE